MIVDTKTLKLHFDYFLKHDELHHNWREIVLNRFKYQPIFELKKCILSVNDSYNSLVNKVDESFPENLNGHWIRFKQRMLDEELDVLQDLIESKDTKKAAYV